jgi:hypothetical protein
VSQAAILTISNGQKRQKKRSKNDENRQLERPYDTLKVSNLYEQESLVTLRPKAVILMQLAASGGALAPSYCRNMTISRPCSHF